MLRQKCFYFKPSGYGHLCDDKHPTINIDEDESYFAADMASALSSTLCFCPVLVSEPEERLAAMVHIGFNLKAGRSRASTLSLRINQRDWPCVAQELRPWV